MTISNLAKVNKLIETASIVSGPKTFAPQLDYLFLNNNGSIIKYMGKFASGTVTAGAKAILAVKISGTLDSTNTAPTDAELVSGWKALSAVTINSALEVEYTDTDKEISYVAFCFYVMGSLSFNVTGSVEVE